MYKEINQKVMSNLEQNLHAKLNLLLNGLGNVQDGQIKISICNPVVKAPGEIETIYSITTSVQFPELISPNYFMSN